MTYKKIICRENGGSAGDTNMAKNLSGDLSFYLPAQSYKQYITGFQIYIKDGNIKAEELGDVAGLSGFHIFIDNGTEQYINQLPITSHNDFLIWFDTEFFNRYGPDKADERIQMKHKFKIPLTLEAGSGKKFGIKLLNDDYSGLDDFYMTVDLYHEI